MIRPSGVSIAPALESPRAPIHAWTPSAMVRRWASFDCWVMCGDFSSRLVDAARFDNPQLSFIRARSEHHGKSRTRDRIVERASPEAHDELAKADGAPGRTR